MKLNEVAELVKNGKICVVAEWRSGEASTRSGFSKGKAWTMTGVVHRLELAGEQFEIGEELPQGTDTTKWVSPFKKGQLVVLQLRLQNEGKGMWRVRCSPLPFEV